VPDPVPIPAVLAPILPWRYRMSRDEEAAVLLLAAYDDYLAGFLEITGRAKDRFLHREWREAQEDHAERLELFTRSVDATMDRVRSLVGCPQGEGPATFRTRFAELTAERPDTDLARTFFNSVVRRVLGTTGVDPRTDFTADPGVPLRGTGEPLVRTAAAHDGTLGDAIEAMFRDTELADHFHDLAADAATCAEAVRRQLHGAAGAVRAVEWLPFPFYRNKAAYLVARLRTVGGDAVPLLVPLEHRGEGVRPDAVLTHRDEVSRVFSFARSYFRACTDRPCETVAFLHTLMPAKPLHELYTSIGRHRHGKTELYRELAAQLAHAEARFEPAEGIPGLVMLVFTLPAFNVVFKVIRDRFRAPKDTSAHEVMEKYRLVFARDRVGRLADAQEFEHLHFPRTRFAPELLEELLREGAGSVRMEGDDVVIRHLYTERRMRPLDLYLREVPAEAAHAAVIEYGDAIRDLACANIFPGDLLLKNFGVSRHGRVIFYDYDELALLTDVRFRALPTASSHEEEMSADPWFSVEEPDVFPEQWLPFLVPPGPLRETFLEHHAELLTVAWWRGIQRTQERGDIPDFYPYPAERRLRLDPPPRPGPAPPPGE
jgi:isocitrate dehydrogenase kinase/phosphatase